MTKNGRLMTKNGRLMVICGRLMVIKEQKMVLGIESAGFACRWKINRADGIRFSLFPR
ncbi:MAG: hypothetical protein LBQ39_08550 [Tannerellaceae bacterium]|jgi:hypothetical protein|nr:hypothetical protein [Tannerellaceae bacterium]